MKKTELARRAFVLYREKKYLMLLLYFLFLFFALAVPAILIAYMTDNVSGWFYLAAPLFIYFSFPLWFGMSITSMLLVDGIRSLLGAPSLFGAEHITFSDVIYRLTGFRVKDE